METMKFQITKIDQFLRNVISLHLKGLIEPFGISKKCSLRFNVGLITAKGIRLSNHFALFFKFSLILMNMQMRKFSYWTTG